MELLSFIIFCVLFFSISRNSENRRMRNKKDDTVINSNTLGSAIN